MSGLELLEHIKQKYHKPPPVVMMITAYGDGENFRIAKELGADDFLTKPVDFTILKEKLKSKVTAKQQFKSESLKQDIDFNNILNI